MEWDYDYRNKVKGQILTWGGKIPRYDTLKSLLIFQILARRCCLYSKYIYHSRPAHGISYGLEKCTASR